MDDGSANAQRAARPTLADRLLAPLETAALAVSMLAIVGVTAIIGLTVFGRTFVGRSIPDSVVLAENLMPLIVALPFAYVAARRGHIEVELFTNRLPPRAIAALNLTANLIGFAIFALIAWGAWNVLARDYATGRFYEGLLRVPAWPAKAFFLLALVLFGLRLALNACDDAWRMATGRDLITHDDDERS